MCPQKSRRRGENHAFCVVGPKQPHAIRTRTPTLLAFQKRIIVREPRFPTTYRKARLNPCNSTSLRSCSLTPSAQRSFPPRGQSRSWQCYPPPFRHRTYWCFGPTDKLYPNASGPSSASRRSCSACSTLRSHGFPSTRWPSIPKDGWPPSSGLPASPFCSSPTP